MKVTVQKNCGMVNIVAGGGATRLRPWGGLWAAIGLTIFLFLPGPVAAQDWVTANPNKIEAAFLRNFARYVIWPPQAFADDRAPWNICILGNDPFGDVLEKTFQSRTEQGRSFELFRADALHELPRCQIVFIAHKDAAKRRAVLAELKSLPVLTVADASGFLQEGGIVRFQVGEHVEIGINLDQARSVAMTIPAKMLEVAREVKENGVVRRWK